MGGFSFSNRNITQSMEPAPENVIKQTVVYEDSVITDVVKKSLPGVVTVGVDRSSLSNLPFGLSPLNRFFSPDPTGADKSPTNQTADIGSGFIVSSDGMVLTNKHVVDSLSYSYQVISNEGKTYKVQSVYRDPLNDLAILKINAHNLSPLPLGDSSHLQPGQMTIAIGTLLGQFRNTVSHGIVSGLGRYIMAGSNLEGSLERLDNVIQTDAAINPGNSGGPLLNSNGDVIGINTAIAEGGQNIGFAIPVNEIKDLISLFKNNGSNFQQPYLGLRYQMIDKTESSLNNTPEGAQIVEVVKNSPAEKAGIRTDDIVLSLDDTKVDGNSNNVFTTLMFQKKVGDKVKITVWRDNQTLTKIVVLESSK